MRFVKVPSIEAVDAAIAAHEPLLLMISFDETEAIVAHIDEAVEHHILLYKAGRDSRDIDKDFRVVLDDEGADWTFICPPDYKGIPDRVRRITTFYKDGFAAISEALRQIGWLVGINIPRRYRRHLEAMGDDSTLL